MIGSLKIDARRSEGRRMTRVAALAVLCALVAAPLAAPAEIYRWTEPDGVERFSDRIENVPEAYRQDVTAQLGEDRPSAPAPAPTPIAEVVPEEPPSAPVPNAPPAADAQLPDWSSQLLGLGVAAAVGLALAGIVLGLLVMAVAIRLACRVVGEEVPRFGRAFAVAAVQLVVGMVVGAVLGVAAVTAALDPASPAFQGVQLLASFGVNAAVLQWMLGQSFGRALVVALLALLITIAVAVAVGIAIALLVGGVAATTG